MWSYDRHGSGSSLNVAFLDFETQGLDPSTTNPTEVGAIRVEWDGDVVREEEKISSLIYSPDYPAQTEEVISLTRITDELLRSEGQPPRRVFETLLNPLLGRSDLVIAHNAPFDRGVYEGASSRIGLPPVTPSQGWVCSLSDVEYAPKYKCKKLSHLAYDHSIIEDPKNLHRAIHDVDLLVRFLTTCYRLEDILAYRLEPWIVVSAEVKAPWTDGGKDNSTAKAHGFRWESPGDGSTWPKKWVKRIKLKHATKLRESCPLNLTEHK